MVKTTLSRSALMLLVTCVALRRGVTAEEIASGASSAKASPPGERVQIPIRGVEFYARSIRLRGTAVTATGDVRARLEQFPRVEVRARKVEYRIGGDKVTLDEPTWSYPMEETESRRLKVRASSATFRIEADTIVAKSVQVETTDGHVSLAAERATWWSKSRECLLESLRGEVFTVTDRDGRGSRADANFDVRIRRATVRLSPELSVEEIKLDRISGVERRDGYVLEADAGTLDSWPGETLREARLSRVKVRDPQGRTLECDKLVYRPPEARGVKQSEESSR